MTALLAKFGLTLAEGKTLGPLIALLALLVALVGGALYGVHVLTGLGYEKAMSECRAAAVAAHDKARNAETNLAEANREVGNIYLVGKTRLAAALPKRIQEVKSHAIKNPDLPQCSLDADSLRRWNAHLLDDGPLPVQPKPDDRGGKQPATISRRNAGGFEN